MKLHKNHLCDSFRHEQDNIDPQLASRIRECTERSYYALRDTSLQILNFAQSLERHIVVSRIEKFSPLVLHCLYRGAFWLSYLATSTGEERFFIGRSIFDRVGNNKFEMEGCRYLRIISVYRWFLLTRLLIGAYLQILESAQNNLSEMLVKGIS